MLLSSLLRRGPREIYFHFGPNFPSFSAFIRARPALPWENKTSSLNTLDVFSIQITKRSLFGRINQADPDTTGYKSPSSRRQLFHQPHRLITHGSHRRNRHLHPLRPHRQAFVSRSDLPSSIPLIYFNLLLVAEAEKRGIEAAGGSATIFQ